MLKTTSRRRASAKGLRFAIIASRYNARYVDSMLRVAVATLKAAGALEIGVVRVPGAFEIPAAAAALAQRPNDPPAALICLGVILRGETTHAQHIGEAVTNALVGIQIRHALPVIHEVLLLENEAQARARCLDARHNRGREAAQTAIAMAGVMRSLRGGR